jgi:hypothetical protein
MVGFAVVPDKSSVGSLTKVVIYSQLRQRQKNPHRRHSSVSKFSTIRNFYYNKTSMLCLYINDMDSPFSSGI